MEEKYAIISNFSITNIIYEIAIISFLKKYEKRRIFQMNLSHVIACRIQSINVANCHSEWVYRRKTYNIKVLQQELRLAFYFLVSNHER